MYRLAVASLKSCSGGGIIIGYFSLSIFLNILSILCEIFIVNISLKGSMTSETSRRGLTPYLTLHLTLAALQFACSIFGLCLFASYSAVPCNQIIISEHIVSALLLVTVISQIIDVTLLTCCFSWVYRWKKVEFKNSDLGNSRSFSFLDTPPKEDLKITVEEEEVFKEYVQGCCQSFLKCVQICSCNVFGGSNVGNDIQVFFLPPLFRHFYSSSCIRSRWLLILLLLFSTTMAFWMWFPQTWSQASFSCGSNSGHTRRPPLNHNLRLRPPRQYLKMAGLRLT